MSRGRFASSLIFAKDNLYSRISLRLKKFAKMLLALPPFLDCRNLAEEIVRPTSAALLVDPWQQTLIM